MTKYEDEEEEDDDEFGIGSKNLLSRRIVIKSNTKT